METENLVIKVFENELCRRQRLNPSYSLRAFARDLGLPVGTLSGVMGGKRKVPSKKAEAVARELGLSPKQQALFLMSAYTQKSALKTLDFEMPTIEHLIDDETYFHVISEWEHYAILSLVETKDFTSESEWIATRLNISKMRAQVCVERLINLKLLVYNNENQLQRNYERVETSDGISSAALKKAHREAINLALDKLEATPIHLRNYSTETFSIDSRKLPLAAEIIKEFRKKMGKLFSDGTEKNEVYQLAIQLYPLTQIKKGERK